MKEKLFFWCVVVVVVPASPLFLMLKNAYEKWRITSAQRRCGRSNARHRLRHAATRLPRQGRLKPTPRFFAAGEVIDFALVAA